MDTRKRKRVLKSPPSVPLNTNHLPVRSLLICFSFFLFLLFLSHLFHIPKRNVPGLPVLSDSSSRGKLPELRIKNRVLLPDSVLVILTVDREVQHRHLSEGMDCIYHQLMLNGSNRGKGVEGMRDKVDVHPVLSVDEYDGYRWLVRCPEPVANYSAVVGLRQHQHHVAEDDWQKERNGTVHKWDMVTYEAVRDGEESAVLFVKGLNLRPDRESDPSRFICHFELGSTKKSENVVLTSKAITAAQEIVRCPLPERVKQKLGKMERVEVTIGMASRVRGRGHLHQLIPSVGNIYGGTKSNETKINKIGKYELCACTMVWNQASTIREWIMYHAWLGVQRWFIYDNNSDDHLKDVIVELDEENYNVTRHVWPWIKSQEAGFSHCALKARDECSWVVFFDVDEFFYFPPPRHQGDRAIANPGQNTLHELVGNLSSSATIGEMRTTCYSFGPSGLSSVPVQGVTLGYTCRLQSPERHKSIVRLRALDDTLLNSVHHFRLRKGFTYLNLPQGTILINHYKYQVWENFKAKFYRRVSTYVADWQENQNEGSRDRAPGLGTEAIEPPNWRLKFCEVWDTGLRDFVLANLADPTTGLLPWQSLARQ
ncbi:hypothetical protein Dimus_036428 [Dionaea muscipula]